MNKTEFIKAIADGQDESVATVSRIINAAIETISAQAADGGEVSLTGFGTFKVVSYEAKMGRNPKTGEQIEIPARKSVRFKAGKLLNGAVNR